MESMDIFMVVVIFQNVNTQNLGYKKTTQELIHGG
jgi:hypothetical protein